MFVVKGTRESPTYQPCESVQPPEVSCPGNDQRRLGKREVKINNLRVGLGGVPIAVRMSKPGRLDVAIDVLATSISH